MKIESASYALESSHVATRRDEVRESLLAWLGSRRPDAQAIANGTTVALSATARSALAADPGYWIGMPQVAAPALPAPQTATDSGPVADAADAAASDPFLQLLIAAVEMLTGHRVGVLSARDLQRRTAAPAVAAPQATAQEPAATPRPLGFGIEYDYHVVHEETEQTRVGATGIVRTADGREIGFKLELSMARSYREESTLSVRIGDAVRKDPLVLNFNGNAAQLSDRRFAFDLDGNGTPENMALLAGGSGYLAIDRNGNGAIDSGRELFGPATGSGFGELAALDSDGNGWIDENDASFSALRVWTPDAEGGGTLETLARRKVGAIALGHVASPFELRGAANADLGSVVASGVFLAEDGRAGSIQEIDLTV